MLDGFGADGDSRLNRRLVWTADDLPQKTLRARLAAAWRYCVPQSLHRSAALLVADLIAYLAVVSISTTAHVPVFSLGDGGFAFQQAALLILILWLTGLYSNRHATEYARFRMRAKSICAFAVLAILHTGIASGIAAHVVLVCGLLLLLGFYFELALRTFVLAPVAVGRDVDSSGPEAPAPTAPYEAGGMANSLGGPPGDPALMTQAHSIAIFAERSQVAYAPIATWQLGNKIGVEVIPDQGLSRSRSLKRILDLALAIPAAILALPLIAVTAAIIWFIDRGSPFYVQTRVGLHGRQIAVPKLRSMYVDADRRLSEHLAASPEARREWQAKFKLANDPRLLPSIGRLIRRSSIDELPQLWSIIKGDMSLVGPRPFPNYHVACFDGEFQRLRSSVQPGLTGLWQVSCRSNGGLAEQRALDLMYVANWSLWLDLYIIVKTVQAVASGNGAR